MAVAIDAVALRDPPRAPTNCADHRDQVSQLQLLQCQSIEGKQFTGYYKTDHQLRTVQATSDLNTCIRGSEIALSIIVRCANTLTYLLT